MRTLSLFICVLITSFSLSVIAGETCDGFARLQEGEFYRSFDRELRLYRLDEMEKRQYDRLKIELEKILNKADTARPDVGEIRDKLETLAQNASKLCMSSYPRGSRVSRSTFLSTIELLDKDPQRSLTDKLNALQHDLVTEYVRNGLDECKRAEQALRDFASRLGRKQRRPRDFSKLKSEIEDRLDDLDVAIARYEIMMKEKRTKAGHIEEMVLSINRVCNSSPSPEIKQPDSMLHWLRCPLGQSWNGMTCKGKPKKMNWESAKRACPVGYRLPSREELIDILGHCEQKVETGGWGSCNKCADSKRCAALFSKDTGWYWSSTPVDKNISWRADFGGGYMAWGLLQESNQVRCVAGGPKEP